jgi:hypothetical protein
MNRYLHLWPMGLLEESVRKALTILQGRCGGDRAPSGQGLANNGATSVRLWEVTKRTHSVTKVGEFSGRLCPESGQFLKVNQGGSSLIKVDKGANGLERKFGTPGWRTKGEEAKSGRQGERTRGRRVSERIVKSDETKPILQRRAGFWCAIWRRDRWTLSV